MKIIIASLALASTLLLGPQANAQIIQDTFTDTDGTTLANHTPDINLPGGSYQQNSPGETGVNGQPVDVISGNAATASASSFSLLSIQSAGTFTAPTGNVTLSADLELGTLAGSDAPDRGILLGFYNYDVGFGSLNPDGVNEVPSGGNANENGYSGILISPTGSVYEDQQGVYTLLGAAPSGFSANSFENLSYNLNASTGVISSVTFDGATYAPLASTILGDAGSGTTELERYVGYFSSGDAEGQLGAVDNLIFEDQAAAVPEPSAWAMVIMGLTGLFWLTASRRRSASL